ncbi:MAG: lytic transglycosylase domain-containing protein [Campylobacterota bacterium]|nr:lytic transglycosylase domain-containing protein [Campylobacterota bacterium]
MLKHFFFILLISAYANAEITLKELSSKPACHAKDFLIWQYLKQDITQKQAEEAYAQATGKNYKLKRAYLKKNTSKELQYKQACKKRKDFFSIEDKECFKLALSSYKTLAMSDKDRKRLEKKVDSPTFIELLKIQSEPYSPESYKKYSADTVLKMFIQTTASHRRKNLNIKLDREFINYLASSKKMSQFIKITTRDKRLNNLQTSILNINPKNLSASSNFMLALHQLKFANNEAAMKHLLITYKESRHRIDKDKASFWLYQVSKEEKYLNQLLLSTDINIYTLYAHEFMESDVDNYYSSLELKNAATEEVDLENPFEWQALHKQIRKTPKDELFGLAAQYKHESMLPVQSLIIQRAYEYKMHGYIMPYEEYMKNVSNDDKALVYAIMRQESAFVPSALSRSFALGLMQMMPFLVDAMSRDMKENITYDEMFKPETNLRYSLKHLEWMKKSLYHPLFMAYAYNGGMGFLRKHLRSGTFANEKHEPYLSMELMANTQSREYGKRVLANYVMYKKILGEEISIIRLFQTLTNPKHTDRFRKQS